MAKGMLVDTTLCIGCKACQVACKEWNNLDGTPEYFEDVDGELKAVNFTGNSYDNTGHTSAYDWRHVRFIEKFEPDRSKTAWYMMSDSCKHCVQAGCLEVCPTHALTRTDLGNVIIQQDVCNGCRDCIGACPFGIMSYNHQTRRVNKCTLCDDRIHAGLETACAKVCPTGSIKYGDVEELMTVAHERVDTYRSQGYAKAQIYGEENILGGLNVFYLIIDDPEVYGLPSNPPLPQAYMIPSTIYAAGAAVILGLSAIVAFRERGARSEVEPGPTEEEV